MNIRNVKPQDAGEIHTLVGSCRPLRVHTAFTYWVVSNFFGRISFVAENDKSELVALSTAIRSVDQPEIAYLWQVGVAEHYRGKRLASQLIVRSALAARDIGCGELQVTISPDNTQSRKAFEHAALHLNTRLEPCGKLRVPGQSESNSPEETLFRMRLNLPST